MQNLLRERIPIRNMVSILEVLGDYAPRTKDPDILTEYVRHALGRSICKLYQDNLGRIKAVTLDPHLEDVINTAVRKSGDVSYVALDPAAIQNIIARTAETVNLSSGDGFQPVVLCSPQIRMHFKRLIERAMPSLAVLSYNEIDPAVKLESVGVIEAA